ncbi:MAG: DUF4115 domain-containing protein [Rhodobacterales bacterium]|nr:DUF4115 domain-containing protein [Rhodobacterales bacterium]
MRGERATLGKSLLDVQRALKIKATYIAAIENADVSVFESAGFISGYVRSYARYLGLDPDWAYDTFCREANFTPGTVLGPVTMGRPAARRPAAGPRPRGAEIRDPFADPRTRFVPPRESWLSQVEPGAVGSILVLVVLIGAIGYGGWSVLKEVQRVQVAPVDQIPAVVAEIDPLGNVTGDAPLVRSAPEAAGQVAAADPVAQGPQVYDRLYRPQALDVPVLVSRDGPIAAIDPRAGTAEVTLSQAAEAAVEQALAEAPVQVVAPEAPPLELLAVRPSWVRISSADGTVLFEKILDAGERYVVPQMEQPPVLRAGNSGSVYFAVNGQTYGPAAAGAQVVKNLELSPEALTAAYQVADLDRDADLARIVALAQAQGTDPAAPVAD